MYLQMLFSTRACGWYNFQNPCERENDILLPLHVDNDLAGLGFMTWFHCLLVFNIAESEVTLSFVPLKITSFFCLDALDFFFFFSAFIFEIQILAFSKAECGHVSREKSWRSLFPIKCYGEMRWKFKWFHISKCLLWHEVVPLTEMLPLSASWGAPLWFEELVSGVTNSHSLKTYLGFGNSQRKSGAKFCWGEWGERCTFWLE